MNKTILAAALIVALFGNVSAQGSGSYCRTNSDCDSKLNLCCSSSKTGVVGYIQFNCATISTPATTTAPAATSTGTCLATNADYTTVCKTESKTCLKTDSKYVACGGSVAMAAVDVLPNISCTSGAMSLAFSSMFALLAIFAFFF